ncbi:MAG: asparagine synthase (glutamine-hydrolyzing), partial [Bdellovibrionales bacterium]|nr:asparagine synthase (glutamine-hydrolyzing) [Bdellovibrionales bacterium]
MCGICGEIRYGGATPNASAVQMMCDEMTSRGPDAAGLFQQQNIAFGHRRLSIIDLSEHAAQPMVDSHLGLTIVFNGAIYNYPELRKELENNGHRFFSNGDTEVILKAYAEWGPECVARLSGMFAFAVWERDSHRVFIARDRLGIKPLYYTEGPGFFRFASSLPALVRAGDVDTDIDPVALHNYMSFHSVVVPPHTILKGVRKLPPATTLTLEPDGKKHFHRYWTLSFDTDTSRSEAEWKEELLVVLRQAVKRRLVADVPVGVLLSGGLDSSLVVGLLAEAGQQGLA